MSDNAKEPLERSEIELLLPWYVTGRLDAADTARVEAFLAAHPDMQRQLALVREEQAGSASANEALGQPSQGLIDRAMASLSREVGTPLWLRATWDKVAAFFAAPTPAGLRWAAAAAGLLLLAQTAVIGALISDRFSNIYETAGSKLTPAAGPTLLVGFADGATASAITALLAEFDAQVIEGPKPGGMYRLRLTRTPATQTALQEVMRRLLARPDIVKIALLNTD